MMPLFSDTQPPEGPVGCRRSQKGWAIKWRSESFLDGTTERLMGSLTGSPGVPAVFETRREARRLQQEKWSYIHHRSDLRREPHGWRSPQVVRVRVTVEEL